MTIPERVQEPVQEPGETINLAKLVRLHDMLAIVSMEARDIPMDTAAIERLATTTAQLLIEVGSAISDSLRAELAGYVTRLSGGMTEDELRVVRAQLAGWVDGLLTGVSLAWNAPPPSDAPESGLGRLGPS